MLFPRDLRILLGSGSNSLTGYNFGVVDDLTVRGGSQRDSMALSYINVWDRGDVNVLSGASNIRVADSYFGQSTWRSSGGNDILSLVRTDLGKRPSISTGAGDDEVFFSGNAEGRVTVRTGSGTDDLWLQGTGEAGYERLYSLNVNMGTQDDSTVVDYPMEADDRLNGGSGSGDLLRSLIEGTPPAGGPKITKYEVFEQIDL